jgi:hypothetical protein
MEIKVTDILSKTLELLKKEGLSPEEYHTLSRIELDITIIKVIPSEKDVNWLINLYNEKFIIPEQF